MNEIVDHRLDDSPAPESGDEEERDKQDQEEGDRKDRLAKLFHTVSNIISMARFKVLKGRDSLRWLHLRK